MVILSLLKWSSTSSLICKHFYSFDRYISTRIILILNHRFPFVSNRSLILLLLYILLYIYMRYFTCTCTERYASVLESSQAYRLSFFFHKTAIQYFIGNRIIESIPETNYYHWYKLYFITIISNLTPPHLIYIRHHQCQPRDFNVSEQPSILAGDYYNQDNALIYTSQGPRVPFNLGERIIWWREDEARYICNLLAKTLI